MKINQIRYIYADEKAINKELYITVEGYGS